MVLIESSKVNSVIKILRFFIGLSVFVWLVWFAPKLAGLETDAFSLIGYIMFPAVIFSAPTAIIGLYFIVTRKFRMRLDVILLALLIFLLFNLQQIITPQQPTGDISGDVRVEIALLREDKTPLTNIEVDIGENPGVPPTGGRQLTNSKGVATFFLKPGKYIVYFNDKDFPKDLMKPIDFPQINVEEGKLNAKTIILNFK